jgi:hypothetical protein
MNKFKEMKEKGNIDVIHKINNYYVNKRDLSKYINDDPAYSYDWLKNKKVILGLI